METLDNNIFIALNFNGGDYLDKLMLTISGTTMWIPLYLLIIFMVFRKSGWKNTIIFILLVVAGISLVDIIAGIFKQTGLLGDVFIGIAPAPRLRPMFAPDLIEAGLVHFPPEAVAGRYGSVSAHAATIVVLTFMSAWVVGRRWFTALVAISAVIICYSRIYLGKHYPADILIGAAIGIATGAILLAAFYKLKRN